MKSTSRIGVIVASLFLLVGASRCSHPVLDPAAPAVQAGDYTALVTGAGIEGCGKQKQAQEGYLYCRIPEGPVPDQSITFLAPVANCGDRETCASVRVYDPTGVRPPLIREFPKDKTRLEVNFKDLFQVSEIHAQDRGFWPYMIEVYYMASDNRLYRVITEGEIRVRVYAPLVCDASGKCLEYEPLVNAPEARYFGWEWKEIFNSKKQAIKMTTSGRTFAE